ncbi:MAG: hypothetical protein JKY65_19360 [Planctomycetes bacterium]|nr:hypothetical protein [Planctomycetota bacterium]
MGESDLARRWVAAAARDGDPRAREVLRAEYPLDEDASFLFKTLAGAPADQWTQDGPAAARILLGDGDPRLVVPALAWLRAARDHRARVYHGVPTAEEAGESWLLAASHLSRVSALLHTNGPGLDRTRLLPDELRALVAGLPETPDYPADAAGVRLRVVCLIDRADDPSLDSLRAELLAPPSIDDARRLEQFDRGRAGECLPGGLPWRPDWVDSVHRDLLTLSLSRSCLRRRLQPPRGSSSRRGPGLACSTWTVPSTSTTTTAMTWETR